MTSSGRTAKGLVKAIV